MPNPPPGPRAKIDRAKKHFADLNSVLETWFDTNPYELVLDDSEEGAPVYRLKVLRPIPVDVPLIFGDMIQNLRSALDHLACELVRHNSGEQAVTNDTNFPIVDEAKKLKAAIPGKVKGASKAAHKAIKALDPYEGSGNPFWAIHKLNNIDKHRVILTAMGKVQSLDFSQPMAVAAARRAAYYAKAGLTDPAAGVSEMSHIYAPVGRQCVEDGDKVHRGPTPDEKKEGYNVPVTFEVAIKESGVIDCEPIIPLAKELIDFVEGVVTSFDPSFV